MQHLREFEPQTRSGNDISPPSKPKGGGGMDRGRGRSMGKIKISENFVTKVRIFLKFFQRFSRLLHVPQIFQNFHSNFCQIFSRIAQSFCKFSSKISQFEIFSTFYSNFLEFHQISSGLARCLFCMGTSPGLALATHE